MTGLRPAPSQLTGYISEYEYPLRQTGMPAEVVEQIFRYGGMVGSVIEHHPLLERAMVYGKQQIERLERQDRAIASGTVILADCLSGSKGRFSRSWHAPPGGLWGCLIHANTFLPHTRLLLPLAVGVACCEAMRDFGATGSAVRWVNDVLVGDLKLAGFLVEGYTSSRHGEEFSMVGFGINLNNRSFPPELHNLAASLQDIIGTPVDIHRFTLCFLAKLCWNIGLLHFEEENELREEGFSGKGGKHALLERWQELSDTLGRRVRFGNDVVEKPLYEATVVGIDRRGGLIMQFDDGSTIVEYSGEVRYLS